MRPPLRWLRREANYLLGIDLRSLAALRIGLGAMLLVDLGCRARDLLAHYTNAGVMPLSIWTEKYSDDRAWYAVRWSLHALSGEPWLAVLLFAVAALFALMLLVGYRTKLATLASLILLMSLQNRNPLVLTGGDGLFRILLIWSLFVPLGAVASVDRLLRPPTAPLPKRHLSFGSAGLLLQMAMMYLFSGLLKDHARWTIDGTAIYFALNIDTYTTEAGRWIRQFPTLMLLLNHATLALEVVCPLLLFTPVIGRWARIPLVVAFMGFHVGLAVTMELGIFPYVALVGWLAFIPSGVWDFARRLAVRWHLNARTARWRDRLTRLVSRLPLGRGEPPLPRRDWIPNVAAAVLLAYVITCNVGSVLEDKRFTRALPDQWKAIGRVTGLRQKWKLFAPYPRAADTWVQMRGELADGSTVNLWEPDEPLLDTMPENLNSHFPNHRWRKYLHNVPTKKNCRFLPYFVDYLRQRWDDEQAADDPSRRVRTVEVVIFREKTPLPGDQPLPPVVVSRKTKDFDP